MAETVKLICLGDIFGAPGRQALKDRLKDLRAEHKADLVIANCENAANGRGITTKFVKELTNAGVDFFTSGNHVFGVAEIFSYLNEADTKVIRPYNMSNSSPGKGLGVVETSSGVKVGVLNLMGRIFMEPGVDLPFDAADQALMELNSLADFVIVDMHAETTAEKRAMGWHLDGRVALVFGTHTHVQTADEEILPGGTGFITDLGMCGPYDSVIGTQKEIILKRFRTGLPQRFEVASGDVRVCGIVCEIDVRLKRCKSIVRINEKLDS
ncbi:MAG: TIGR00282 family metallophosphoesterase [Deltaproteobacteria bacterium]|nr:TIGR00282 family metallophosphoesterase [Deltaproteobacteria bacterium]